MILGSTMKLAEFNPMISRASICSVTLMVPISEAMLLPTFPARISDSAGEFKNKNLACCQPGGIGGNHRGDNIDCHLNTYHSTNENGYDNDQRDGIHTKFAYLEYKLLEEFLPFLRNPENLRHEDTISAKRFYRRYKHINSNKKVK